MNCHCQLAKSLVKDSLLTMPPKMRLCNRARFSRCSVGRLSAVSPIRKTREKAKRRKEDFSKEEGSQSVFPFRHFATLNMDDSREVWRSLALACLGAYNAGNIYNRRNVMLVIAGTIPIKAEHREEARKHAGYLEAETRKEPGCLMYTFYADRDDPNTFFI